MKGRPVIAYVALGSNLGNRESNIEAAITALRATPDTEVISVSDIFETPPVGPVDQSAFLNAAAKLATMLAPRELLTHCLKTESARGRTRVGGKRWGPRTLDIDLLLYDDLILNEPGLTLPHPRMAERGFVLAPLAQIAPEVRHPLTKLTVRELLSRLQQHEKMEYTIVAKCFHHAVVAEHGS